jgi:membrane fusion protein, macrolide-specific efflux system
MTKKRILIILVLLIIVGAFVGKKYYAKDDAKKATEEAVAVTRGTIEQVITSQGTLEPKEYVDVGAQVSGQLKKLHVDIGDFVKKGDLIAEIDPQIYLARVQGDEAKLKTLNAQLAEQNAQIKLAKQQFDRNSRLLKSKAVSQDVMQTSETAYQVATARATSLKAQIEEAESVLSGDKTNLSFTTIYAPIDGTVVVQTSREGQTLNANQTAPVIVQLANLDTMTVRAQVAEADVMNLKEGMDVYFTVLGNMKRRWQGKVRQILPSPEVVNEVVLYNVLVDADNSDHQLMTGMTTQMFFMQGKAENALLIPTSALIKPVPEQNNDQGEAHTVRLAGGGEKTVHIGLSNRTHTEIRDGLTDTDRVMIPKVTATTPGQRPTMGPRI